MSSGPHSKAPSLVSGPFLPARLFICANLSGLIHRRDRCVTFPLYPRAGCLMAVVVSDFPFSTPPDLQPPFFNFPPFDFFSLSPSTSLHGACWSHSRPTPRLSCGKTSVSSAPPACAAPLLILLCFLRRSPRVYLNPKSSNLNPLSPADATPHFFRYVTAFFELVAHFFLLDWIGSRLPHNPFPESPSKTYTR